MSQAFTRRNGDMASVFFSKKKKKLKSFLSIHYDTVRRGKYRVTQNLNIRKILNFSFVEITSSIFKIADDQQIANWDNFAYRDERLYHQKIRRKTPYHVQKGLEKALQSFTKTFRLKIR